MLDVQPRAELAVLATFGQAMDHRDAEGTLRVEGWNRCGEGDWAIALQSPSGAYAARISPFDPASPYSAALYRRAGHTGQVPHLEAEVALNGGANLLVMEFLFQVEADRAATHHRAIAARAAHVAELADLIATIHADAARELPWCGPLDNNPANVMQNKEGVLVIVDPFYADGPNLYAAVLDDPSRVAASIPSEQRQHMLDIPRLRSSELFEPAVLDQMHAHLAAADIAINTAKLDR